MRQSTSRLAICLVASLSLIPLSKRDLRAADPDPVAVQTAIDSAKRALLKVQHADGSWRQSSGDFNIGTTGLVTLALRSAGMKADDPEIARGKCHPKQAGRLRASGNCRIALVVGALQSRKLT
jgi:hypothetical protein